MSCVMCGALRDVCDMLFNVNVMWHVVCTVLCCVLFVIWCLRCVAGCMMYSVRVVLYMIWCVLHYVCYM